MHRIAIRVLNNKPTVLLTREPPATCKHPVGPIAFKPEVLIRPRRGWQPVDLRELWSFRELLGFLIWRDIKVRYKQTILGGLWAVLQPLVGTLVFGILFTRVAPIQTPGIPYPLFIYAGLIPWTFFANALTVSSNSLIGSEQMIRKTYLPRLFLPMGASLGLILDMLINVALFGLLLAYYRWPVTVSICWLPLCMASSILVASGLGIILSALNVYYRDIKYVVPFLTQMAFFLTPIIYPLQNASDNLRALLALNPMAGVEEGFRHALLGAPVSNGLIWVAAAAGLTLFVIGLYVFRRMERAFADHI
jgi:lipopolysaccharide transport system permease protein